MNSRVSIGGKIGKILGIIFASIFILIGAFFCITSPAFNKNRIKITATVVSTREETKLEDYTDDSNTTYKRNVTYYYPQLKYTVKGKTYLSEPNYSQTDKFSIGSTMDVYYDVNNPSDIEINSATFGLVFIGFGVVFIIISYLKS